MIKLYVKLIISYFNYDAYQFKPLIIFLAYQINTSIKTEKK